jgi:hypothetical protein
MFKMLRRAAVAGLATVALAAVPAAAKAATVAVTDPCPRVGFANASVSITATGFAAGEQVSFSYGDVNQPPVVTGTADAVGNLSGGIPAPDIGTHNLGTVTVAARGLTSGATAATAPFPVVRPKVDLPNSGRPNSRVLYKVYGFPNGRPVYAHYTFHGKQRAVLKLGTAKGPCGLLKKRARLLPAEFHTGQWVYHFNNSKTNRNQRPLYEIRYLFSRIFR